MRSFSVAVRRAIACLTLLSLVSFPAVAEYPRAYFGAPDVYDISMSPDGSATAYLTNEATTGVKVSMVWDRMDVLDNETGDIIYTERQAEQFIGWVSWVFDDVVLVQVIPWNVPNKSGKRIGYLPAIKAINPKTRETRDIWTGEWVTGENPLELPDYVDFSRERREIVVQFERKSSVELMAINIDTGAQRLLDTGNKRTLRWALDENLSPYMRIDKGRRDNQSLIYRRAADGKWEIVSVFNPLENDFRALSRIDDNNSLLVIFRPRGAEQAGLYRYNLQSDTYEELLFETEGRDLVGYGEQSFNGVLLYVSWFEDNLRKHWLKEEYQAIADQISAALRPDDNWRVVETSLDGTRWLLYISSPRRAGRYYYMNLDTKRIKPVVKTRPDLLDEHLYPQKVVTYQARDGLELFGYFIQGDIGPEAPLIVLPHGGPVARDNPDYDGLAQFLAFQGYNVFQPQFRGSGGFGVAFEVAGFGEWGQKMQTDIDDGVQALVDQNLVGPSVPRSILGGSYGGYAALVAATLTPENYQCVVSFNGVSDLPLMLSSYDQSDIVEKYVYDIWTMRIGDPVTELDKIVSVSPYHHLEKVKAPVFLFHGTKDDIVDVEQSRRAYARLKELGKTVYLHELLEADHQLSDDDHRAEMLAMLDRFLKACMPAR